MNRVRFDESLPALVLVIEDILGEEALEKGTVLRDAIGCLSFYSAEPMDDETHAKLSLVLLEQLGAYARKDRMVAQPTDFGSEVIRNDPSALTVWVENERKRSAVRLVDRRIVGADWLHRSAPPAPPPPRFVFASLKGGVGRSTALAVTAAHLANRGKRVLAVDLDLEAPGLGALLLSRETLPEFGMLDALVENGLGGLDELFFADLVGSSALAAQAGKIDVIPAIGKRSLDNPAEVLAKIARAYTEDIRQDGSSATLLDQIREVIDHFSDPERFDVILIDARAGLHETTAAAILGLGAEVLLFGLDEPQTFQGYELLLAHLARLPKDGPLFSWAERLTMVQGKAPVDAEQRRDFTREISNLFWKVALRQGPGFSTEPKVETPSKVTWDDSLTDEEVLPAEWALPEPIAILNDHRFQHFDPNRRRDLLSDRLYKMAFGDLLERVDTSLQSWEEAR